jgi:hypothetical protein
MQYLVVQERSREASVLHLVQDARTMIAGRFEPWAIKTGKQVMFVRVQAARTLAPLHVSGDFPDSEAVYALAYDDLIAVLREHMGPSDRERWEQARSDLMRRRKVVATSWLRALVLIGIFGLGAVVLIGLLALKLLLFTIVFPFFIAWVGKRN